MVIIQIAPTVFLAQVHKQAQQAPAHVPTALMDGAAKILRDWAETSGLTMDDAAYIAGWAISHADNCPPEYAAVLDAASRFGADCVAAGYGAAYADRNFSAVVGYAATGTAQVAV